MQHRTGRGDYVLNDLITTGDFLSILFLEEPHGAAARGGGPHAKTPLKAIKAKTTMLLPAAAAARGGPGPRP
ncbi:hypothetical protein T492DRAFT_887808 [Pavlovales sp. CCMP2436]|nr:hypothetical protein T492DRAFT_887808 [Pavlovales sp. CCMP2436]